MKKVVSFLVMIIFLIAIFALGVVAGRNSMEKKYNSYQDNLDITGSIVENVELEESQLEVYNPSTGEVWNSIEEFEDRDLNLGDSR